MSELTGKKSISKIVKRDDPIASQQDNPTQIYKYLTHCEISDALP